MLKALAIVATGLLLVVGCAPPDPNGGNLLTAGAKLISNPQDPPIGDLTSGELIAITANLPSLAAQFPTLGIPIGADFPTLTEEQAQDAVGFLDEHNIQTVSQFQAFIVQASQGTVQVEIPPSLIDFAKSLGYETDAAKLAPEM